ncbi:MAG TPA: GNAT family N-acetyltransferase [Mycobacteriales bacterium]|nr:GNAT family N-acetyltransferase [Mycobacteriales bacterium]
MTPVEDFDPCTASPEDQRAWCVVASEVDQEQRPGEPVRPLDSHLARLLGKDHAWTEHHWVARDTGGEIVGIATASSPNAPENRDLLFLEVGVLPARRRERVGSALAHAATAYGRTQGRELVTVEAKSGGPGSAFLAAHGAEQKTVERRSLLDLRAVDVDALLQWGQPKPGASDRYTLVQWRDTTPEELVSDHADMRTAMNDAPRESLELEDEIYTDERIRAYEATIAGRGDELWVTCAREEQSGRLVALTDLNGPSGWPEFAFQEDTVVLSEHRGHGLGRWIKAANLAFLLADRPSTEWVQTFNAEVNRHMLDVNEAMGFRAADEWGEWQVSADRLEQSFRR